MLLGSSDQPLHPYCVSDSGSYMAPLFCPSRPGYLFQISPPGEHIQPWCSGPAQWGLPLKRARKGWRPPQRLFTLAGIWTKANLMSSTHISFIAWGPHLIQNVYHNNVPLDSHMFGRCPLPHTHNSGCKHNHIVVWLWNQSPLLPFLIFFSCWAMSSVELSNNHILNWWLKTERGRMIGFQYKENGFNGFETQL